MESPQLSLMTNQELRSLPVVSRIRSFLDSRHLQHNAIDVFARYITRFGNTFIFYIGGIKKVIITWLWDGIGSKKQVTLPSMDSTMSLTGPINASSGEASVRPWSSGRIRNDDASTSVHLGDSLPC